MPNELVSKETFESELKKIYADGDWDAAYESYRNKVKFTTNGLDFTMLVEQFRRHIMRWNREYGSRDAKYISNDAKKKKLIINHFIDREAYKLSFDLSTPRDKYLFPENENLTESRKKFDEQFGTRE